MERQVLNNNKTIFSLFGLNEVIVRINLYFLLGSELLLSRRVFSAQDCPRQNLTICPGPSGNELSDYIFKNSVVVCSPNGNVKRATTKSFFAWRPLVSVRGGGVRVIEGHTVATIKHDRSVQKIIPKP